MGKSLDRRWAGYRPINPHTAQSCVDCAGFAATGGPLMRGTTTRDLPERGRIGIFNRSYYEEVLIARVARCWARK
jgi:hypothetical protein